MYILDCRFEGIIVEQKRGLDVKGLTSEDTHLHEEMQGVKIWGFGLIWELSAHGVCFEELNRICAVFNHN